MLPINHLFINEHPLKEDTKKFLNGVLLALLNLLSAENRDTKKVEFFASNDILVFRGKNIVIFSFSRSTYLFQPRFGEILLSELSPVIKSEVDTYIAAQLDSNPDVVVDVDWDNFLEQRYGVVNPFSVTFPLSFLSLPDEVMIEAQRKVAELMVEPSLEDIDRNTRVVRVDPEFRGRNFLLEPDLCFVIMEYKKSYLEIYNTVIKPTVEGENFRCIKADDIYTTASVIEDIWENINKATLIIAEISSNNPLSPPHKIEPVEVRMFR